MMETALINQLVHNFALLLRNGAGRCKQDSEQFCVCFFQTRGAGLSVLYPSWRERLESNCYFCFAFLWFALSCLCGWEFSSRATRKHWEEAFFFWFEAASALCAADVLDRSLHLLLRADVLCRPRDPFAFFARASLARPRVLWRRW